MIIYDGPKAPVKSKTKAEASGNSKAKRRLKKREFDTFCSFVILVVERLFPVDKIASQLFLDVVRFYSVDNVSGLRYDANDKSMLLFWIF